VEIKAKAKGNTNRRTINDHNSFVEPQLIKSEQRRNQPANEKERRSGGVLIILLLLSFLEKKFLSSTKTHRREEQIIAFYDRFRGAQVRIYGILIKALKVARVLLGVAREEAHAACLSLHFDACLLAGCNVGNQTTIIGKHLKARIVLLCS